MHASGSHLDSEFLSRYAHGDAAAFRAFFRRHHPRVVAALRESGVASCECVPRAEHCFLRFHARLGVLGRRPALEDFAAVVGEVAREGVRGRLRGRRGAPLPPDLGLLAERGTVALPAIRVTPGSAAERITERALERVSRRVRKDLVEDGARLVRASLGTWAAGAAVTALVLAENVPHGWSEGLVVLLPVVVSFGVLSPFQRRHLRARFASRLERAARGLYPRTGRSRNRTDGKRAP